MAISDNINDSKEKETILLTEVEINGKAAQLDGTYALEKKENGADGQVCHYRLEDTTIKDNTADIQHFSRTHYLWIAQSGNEHGTFTTVGKDITHHICRKNELYIQISKFLSIQELCVKGSLHISDRHKSSSKNRNRTFFVAVQLSGMRGTVTVSVSITSAKLKSNNCINSN